MYLTLQKKKKKIDQQFSKKKYITNLEILKYLLSIYFEIQ